MDAEKTIARILKVNHAGEYGAIRIYRAQLWVARRFQPDLASFLSETLAHEVDHCRRFREAMTTHRSRPCRAMWLWSTGGIVLGLATALMGRNAIMACTAAVEATVHRHLDEQIDYLTPRDRTLADLIADIRVQEIEHLDFARSHLRPTGFSRFLGSLVTTSTETVIWLSTQGAVSRMKRTLSGKRA
ncbi:MAG: demethoxyubiquinone hydroxylase family protein [Asticcacaulis sp.]